MKRAIALAVMLFAFAVMGHAQTTQSSISVGVNAGDHSWATFTFGHSIDGEPGATQLIVQCAFHRAFLITNFDVYGEQQEGELNNILCVQKPTVMVDGYPSTTWTVQATPFTTLVLMNGSGSPQPLNVTLTDASWTFTGYCGHGRCAGPGATGSATITY